MRLVSYRSAADPGVRIGALLEEGLVDLSEGLGLTSMRQLLDEAGSQPGFIFNLGHGMIPSAKIECVEALMEVVTDQKNV